MLKPAEQSPLGAIFLAALAKQAGLPDGVLNVAPGFGERAGKPLALHADVDILSFAGSTEVGKIMLRYSGESNMKRVSLECGGKSPHVAMPDADIKAAAEAIAWGMYCNQGETCHAGSSVLVHASARAKVGDNHELLVDRNQGWRMSWDIYAPWPLKDAIKGRAQARTAWRLLDGGAAASRRSRRDAPFARNGARACGRRRNDQQAL